MATQNTESQVGEPYLLADHLALDLLNTEARVYGEVVDFWHSDEDVLRWLERCGFARNSIDGAFAPQGFLVAAKELRAAARELIEQRKKGETGNPDRLTASCMISKVRRIWNGEARATFA